MEIIYDRILKLNNIIDVLIERNGWKYNIDKTIEELLELAEVLMKKKLKKGGIKEPDDQEVIDEIGDVVIRLAIMSRIFGDEKVGERIEYKCNNFTGYIKNNEYKHI